MLLLLSAFISSVLPAASLSLSLSVCTSNDACIVAGESIARLSLPAVNHGAWAPFSSLLLAISAPIDALVYVNVTSRNGAALALFASGKLPSESLTLLVPGESVSCNVHSASHASPECVSSFTLAGSSSAVSEWLGNLATTEPTLSSMSSHVSGFTLSTTTLVFWIFDDSADAVQIDIDIIATRDIISDREKSANLPLMLSLPINNKISVAENGSPVCLSNETFQVNVLSNSNMLSRISITLSIDTYGIGEYSEPEDSGAFLSILHDCDGDKCVEGSSVGGVAAHISQISSRALSFEGEADALADLLYGQTIDSACIAITAKNADVNGRVRVHVSSSTMENDVTSSINFLIYFKSITSISDDMDAVVYKDLQQQQQQRRRLTASSLAPPSTQTLLTLKQPSITSTSLYVIGNSSLNFHGNKVVVGYAYFPSMNVSTLLYDSTFTNKDNGALILEIDCNDELHPSCAGASLSEENISSLRLFTCEDNKIQIWGDGKTLINALNFEKIRLHSLSQKWTTLVTPTAPVSLRLLYLSQDKVADALRRVNNGCNIAIAYSMLLANLKLSVNWNILPLQIFFETHKNIRKVMIYDNLWNADGLVAGPALLAGRSLDWKISNGNEQTRISCVITVLPAFFFTIY